MRNLARLLAPALLGLCSACTSPEAAEAPLTEGTVAYSWQGAQCTVTDARTPYDGDAACRQAFLTWFAAGFSHGLRGVPVSVEWMPTPKGRAGRHGYDCGFVAGEQLARQSPAPQAGSARVSVAPAGL